MQQQHSFGICFNLLFFVRSLLVLTAEMSRGAWFLSFRAAFHAVEQLRNASGRGCGGGSGGSGVLKAPGEKKSTHWFIGIDRQSYQPLQIYDGHFCAAARAERIIGLIALSSSAAFYLNFRRCQQKVWRLILFPPPVEKNIGPVLPGPAVAISMKDWWGSSGRYKAKCLVY